VKQEIKTLYQAIKQHLMQGKELKVEVKNPRVRVFQYFYKLLVALFKVEQVSQFKTCLEAILAQLHTQGTAYATKLRDELLVRLPAKGLTAKNVPYYRRKVKGALSLVLRQFRQQVEQDQRDFKQVKFLLLKRPEKLSPYESCALQAFLRLHPAFCKYRALSMRVSDIYALPPEKLTRTMIADIELWEDPHPTLQSAVETLKKNLDKIFNFVRLYSHPKYKKYAKIPRVTPEPQMKKIKDLYRNKCGFRTLATTQLLLENQLQCQVFVSSA